MTHMTYPKGVTLQIPRDELGRPLARIHSGSVDSFEYGYRADGNLDFEKRSGVQTTVDLYQYDALKHITDIKYKVPASPTGQPITLANKPTAPSYVSGTGEQEQETLDLDLLNNRRVQSVTSATKNYNKFFGSYQPDSMNKITQIETILGTGNSLETLAYDPNHNLSNDGKFAYTFDSENRLKEIRNTSDNVLIASYSYDPLGRRISKTIHSSLITSHCFYDGWQCFEEQDSSGIVRANTFGLGLDDALAITTNANTVYLHKNNLDSVTSVSDSSGSLLENISYDIHGTPVVVDAENNPLSVSQSSFLFTGQRFDPESGLFYYKNRLYSPSLGRFLSLDPAGDVDGMNLYGYVRGNPVNAVDPMGLWTSPEGHERIIRKALGEYLTQEQLYYVILSNDYFDLSTQFTSDAYLHSMTSPGQSVGNAKVLRSMFKDEKIQEIRRIRKERLGDCPKSDAVLWDEDELTLFGQLQHPFADESSPAHGWQEWYLPAYVASGQFRFCHSEGDDISNLYRNGRIYRASKIIFELFVEASASE